METGGLRGIYAQFPLGSRGSRGSILSRENLRAQCVGYGPFEHGHSDYWMVEFQHTDGYLLAGHTPLKIVHVQVAPLRIRRNGVIFQPG